MPNTILSRAEEEEFQAKKIVRVYSYHAEERLPPPSPANNLACVLSSREPSLEDAEDPWRKFYEPRDLEDAEINPTTALLAVQANNLQKQWVEFQALIPKEEQIDTRTTEPTVQGFVTIIEGMHQKWVTGREKGHRGKAASYFHKVCEKIDAHSNMLGVIPQGNQYTSLFTGTLTSIVKASVNHEQIAEDLSKALVMINETVADCERDLEMYRTEEMMRQIANLYAYIFEFLGGVMRWQLKSKRRRMLDSFNEKFFDQFQEDIDKIRNQSMNIQRRAEQSAHAEQRSTRLTAERAVRVAETTAHYVQGVDKRLDGLHNCLTSLLETTARTQMHTQIVFVDTNQIQQIRGSNTPLLMHRRISDAGSVITLDASLIATTREELSLHSKHLEKLFYRDRIQLPCERFTVTQVDPQALSQITDWTISPTSLILSIAGPYFEGDELGNPTSMLAAKFVEYATANKVPIISYFCEIRRGIQRNSDDTRETFALMEMLYALIRQLIPILDEEIDTSSDFSAERFGKLDGTGISFKKAVALFGDIVRLLPERVFCVIDGMQWIDDRSTKKNTKDLIQVLRHKSLKVLFTTSGPSRSLLNELNSDEMWFFDGGEKKGEWGEFDIDMKRQG